MRATSLHSHRILRRLATVVRAVSRYDLVLAVIPLALTTGALFGVTAGIPDSLGVGGGGIIAIVATAYALFGDPPVGPRTARSASPSRLGHTRGSLGRRRA